MKKAIITAIVMSTIFIFAGCSTMQDAKQAKGTGQNQVYIASSEDVWHAIPVILTEVGLEKVEENRAGGYILANRSISFRSYGERLAIFIDPIDASRTKVEVVSKKAVPGTLFTINWPYKIFEALEKRFKVE